jgi:HAD superfamily phosphatase (TIGR01668 family)
MPKMYVSSVLSIEPELLSNKGIRCVLFDLDNTLIPRDQIILSEDVSQWIKSLVDKGIKVCVVSNNGPDRIGRIADICTLPFVCRAAKPRRNAFRRAMSMLEVSAEETAVVGDQIFTDILGGNRLGLFTILVVPMPGKEYWATKLINRRLEKLVMKKIKRKVPLEVDSK